MIMSSTTENFACDPQISSDGNFESFVEEQPSVKPGNGSGDSNSAADIDDDTADDSRKIFVGGLSWETTEKDLKEYFGSFGDVKTCTIKVDKYTGHSRGFGFVIFENEECVAKTLEVKDHRLKNKKIDPKRAKPSREPQKKIFVGGLDPEITEEQIREYFGKFGKIDSLDLPFDSAKGKRKAYIFVTFATEPEAKKAAANEKHEIFGKRCDVRVAVPREQTTRYRGWGGMGGWGPNWVAAGYYPGTGYPAAASYDYAAAAAAAYGYPYTYPAAAGYAYGPGYGTYDYSMYGGYGGRQGGGPTTGGKGGRGRSHGGQQQHGGQGAAAAASGNGTISNSNQGQQESSQAPVEPDQGSSNGTTTAAEQQQ